MHTSNTEQNITESELKRILEEPLFDSKAIVFASSKWEPGTINRNNPLYSAIHTQLRDISEWVKAGGKLELHHIDNAVEKIIEGLVSEQRRRAEQKLSQESNK